MQFPISVAPPANVPQPIPPFSSNGNGFFFSPRAPIAPQSGEVGVTNIFQPPGNPRRYGAAGVSTTVDQLALVNALASARGMGTFVVQYDAGVFLIGANITLDATYSGIKIYGAGSGVPGAPGATILSKQFDGNFLSLNTCVGFGIDHLTINGNNRTGVILEFQANCNFPIVGYDTFFYECTASDNVTFVANSGYNGKFQSTHFTSLAVDYNAYKVIGPDSTATPRKFDIIANGRVVLNGAFDSLFNNPFVTRIDVDANCSITLITGGVMADTLNFGVTPITFHGTHTNVIGCRIANDVVLAADLANSCFIGNIQSGGTFTDNTVPGNCIILHQPLATTYQRFGKFTLPNSLAGGEVQVTSSNANGDFDLTYNPIATASTLIFNVGLTANRTLTMGTTGARNGQRVRVSRSGGGAFTLAIAPTGKTLAASQWADVQYNGSFWEIVGFGSL